MPSWSRARAICVGFCGCTGSPAFGVHAIWLPRSEYNEQASRFNNTFECGHNRHRRFFIDQLHVIDLAGRIIEDHDEVLILIQTRNPSMTASIHMQHHARQRTSWTLLAVRSALGVSPHQSGILEGRLDPCIAERNLFLAVQLLHEML